MPIRALYEQWFSYMLAKLKRLPDDSKTRLAFHWQYKLDEGARKTLYHYMYSVDSKVCWSACFYIAEQYYNKDFDESRSVWVVDNPSAALIATVRRAFFDDYVFAWAYLDVDIRCQASRDKLQ